MKNGRWIFIILFSLLLLAPTFPYAKTWTIGILAVRGEKQMQKEWQPWVDWLNLNFIAEQFQLVPLQLDDLAQKQIDHLDFILTNQAQFFYLNDKTLRWLATLNTKTYSESAQNKERIGSAIVVRSDSPYHHLLDLKNKTVSAVGQSAFGGFLLGYNELYQKGLRENQDIHFVFTGFPTDTTLLLLKNHQVDVAIAPACLLEQMIAEGILSKHHFRVLAQRPNQLGCVVSTILLPNWSLAAMPQVPDGLAAELIKYLLSPTPAHLPQWTPPFSNTQADQILRNIDRHPQQNVWRMLIFWIEQHKIPLLSILVFIVFNYVWISYQVHRKSKALVLAYQEMNNYQQQLIKIDRLCLLGEMTTGIAHEINQPLTAIRMYVEGLKQQVAKKHSVDSQLAVLNKIVQQVERSKQVMSNITTWAKDKNNENISTCLLYELLSRTIHFIQRHNAKDQNFSLHCDKQMQVKVKRTSLEQIIANCLLNALQANANEIQVVVCQNGQHIEIDIVDNGTGFTQTELNFPFVPFRSTKQDGLGLGLVLCQRLIFTMQGNIKLCNRADQQGAVVRLTLPLQHPE
ncbi:sensor histidine kinase [Spirabiliibacterium falconis]|uniref:sensor histidine kinase n=1 Tax=Spirabiliibacterium falconis TaxID=572023 RepID=UPI001AAC6AB0|nr:sensor histidine kinase [Spirabiliibacterium falconis]MBE2894353.1 PhnD/SsuA/transferrin family substrate-binding protein [Spirabiliibacterium falconis]